ncbi:MAG: transcription antitermination factor NusB, partial [Bacteroidota bacterium]
NLLQLVNVAQYAVKDAARRTAKLLPNEEDKQFTAKLYENDVMQALVENTQFELAVKRYKLRGKFDDDAYRNFYTEFARTDEYKAYLTNPETKFEDHIKILLALYKSCVANELFSDTMEDYFPNWVDDKSLVVGTIKKTIKALPSNTDFCDLYKPNDETTREFGETLLQKVMDQSEELLGIIEPALKNWDADRVAILDMILLKMALTELMTFTTIPMKVTLNEFVEIAKQYSTEKSKDFINGILDRLMKKLEKQGKIKKEGRGLLG